MTYGKMLKILKESIANHDFERFPVMFFDDKTGEIYPYEQIKDFCFYWLQKDIDSYKDFRNEFAAFRTNKLILLDAISVICSEEVRKKINPITMLQFRILVLNFTDTISTTLNLAEMLIACCSDIIEKLATASSDDDKKD